MEKKKKANVTIENIAELISDSQKLTVKRLDKRISQSYEGLAHMVANGFIEQEKKITEKLTEKIEGVEARLGQQINGLGNRIDKLVDDKVAWTDHNRLADRVSRLEMATPFKK